MAYCSSCGAVSKGPFCAICGTEAPLPDRTQPEAQELRNPAVHANDIAAPNIWGFLGVFVGIVFLAVIAAFFLCEFALLLINIIVGKASIETSPLVLIAYFLGYAPIGIAFLFLISNRLNPHD